MATFLVPGLQPEGGRDEVESLGGVACEHDLFRRGSDEPGDFPAHRFHPLAQRAPVLTDGIGFELTNDRLLRVDQEPRRGAQAPRVQVNEVVRHEKLPPKPREFGGPDWGQGDPRESEGGHFQELTSFVHGHHRESFFPPMSTLPILRSGS